MPIREEFPEAGSNYMDGESNGWEYKMVFAGTNLEASYKMLCQFLKEEGYGDIPLPKDTEELLLFKYPPIEKQRKLFFDQYGYKHNPIKISFLPLKRQAKVLILHLYNEEAENHLTKFHGVL